MGEYYPLCLCSLLPLSLSLSLTCLGMVLPKWAMDNQDNSFTGMATGQSDQEDLSTETLFR